MDGLVRAIKDLDQTTFQQLCFQLMSEKYPTTKIRYPEGVAGDEGVDLFLGDLTSRPTVWQCKAFQTTLVGDSQKAQIKESLRDAVRNVRPKVWILCLNMNFDVKAARWFKRLQDSYKVHGVAVADAFEGMDLARELIFRRTLKTHYFPGLSIDVDGMKSLMKAAARGGKEVDDVSLEKLATEDVEEWLDRLRDKDPRFTYEVTFGGDRGPTIFPPPPEPLLISAITDGRKTVKAFVRDPEALKLDPVSSHIEFNGGAEGKLFDFIRTGREQQWGPSEIRSFKSNVPFLSNLKSGTGGLSLRVRPVLDQTIIPLKMTLTSTESITTLEYLEFMKVRGGNQEVEIKTINDAPLGLTLVLPMNEPTSVTATVSTHLGGSRIKDVVKACAALKAMCKGCDVELFAIKLDAKLCKFRIDPLPPVLSDGTLQVVEDLNSIAAKFNKNFVLPEDDAFGPADEETFRILRAFTLGEPLELENFRSNLIKTTENSRLVSSNLSEEMAFRLEHESATATLFGTHIDLGPTIIQIDRARINDLSMTIQNFSRAEIGAAVPISLTPLTPVHFRLTDRASLLSTNEK